MEDVQRDIDAIDELAKEADNLDASADLLAAWTEWRRIYGEAEMVRMGASAARTRLSKLPIFKRSA